jgi:hypothetical protein
MVWKLGVNSRADGTVMFRFIFDAVTYLYIMKLNVLCFAASQIFGFLVFFKNDKSCHAIIHSLCTEYKAFVVIAMEAVVSL